MMLLKTFLWYFVVISIDIVIIQANNENFLKKLKNDEIAETDCICENGHCKKDSTTGKETCVCPPEYGLFTPQKCKECGCGRGANCTVVKGWFADKVECICPKGIKKKADKRCEDPCDSSPCQNGGTCKIDYRGMACECPLYFNGDRCEKANPCENNPCQNGGTCKIDYGGMTCECPPSFTGDRCEEEILECDCENGRCIRDTSGDIQCVCLSEFGLNKGKCEACDCGKGANCTFEGAWIFADKYCICPNGQIRRNKRCEDPCPNNPCLNGGTCETDGRLFNCSCFDGYYGEICEKHLCTNNPCKNGGTCAISEGYFKCLCRPYYYGERCEKVVQISTIPPTFKTSAFPLEFNQTTDQSKIITENYKQTTHDQYNFTIDFSQTTSKTFNRTTDFTETTYTTSELSYSTTIASSQTPGCDCGTKSIACKFDDYGNKRCLCRHGFAQLKDTCSDCYCGEHSTACFFDLYGDKRCICNEGYSQRNMTCSAICQSDSDCWNGGTCKMDSSGYTFCVCAKGFSGDRCERDSACKNLEAMCQKFYAVCMMVNGKPTCECPPEKLFRLSTGLCENICDWKTCVQGQCEKREGSYICRCHEGYTGPKCDIRIVSISKNQILLYILMSSLFVIFILAISMTVALKYRRRGKRNNIG